MNLVQKITLILFVSIPGFSQGCLWDSDTIATESARFPGVAAIMTGNFPRHSPEYHDWRVQQKKALVEAGKATASDYDDLAVSQHKLGDHVGAINTMMAKEKKMPGRYETYSNLGTFYIYTGEFRTAIQWIDKALSINHNAHFGREKYQRWLVMWHLERLADVKSQAEVADAIKSGIPGKPVNFVRFVAQQESGRAVPKDEAVNFTEVQRNAAIRGVTGMMYFADYDNPLLQEALGDLLAFGPMKINASQLAAMCYLHASEKTATPVEKARLKMLSKYQGRDEKLIEKLLDTGYDKGLKLNEKIRAEERAWLAAGKDVTVEFQKKYLQAAR